jgi:putative ABC transport system permease protein
VEPNNITPPRYAQSMLLRFLREDLAEEVLGDLEEKFYQTAGSKSLFRARLNYWYQVFQYLRPFAIRRLKSSHLNHYTMYKNYFTIGWRNLIKQKMYSSIKVGGFALGITACFLIALFIRDELSFDKHIPNADRIFRVVDVYNENGEIFRGTWFQAPFANALKEDYPEIEKAGRINSNPLFGAGGNEFRRADRPENTYEEGFTYADQEFLELLGVPFVYGNPAHSLDQPNTIVLTRRKAEKYFPGENPVGKPVVLNGNAAVVYTIGGVIENFPSTSHLQHDFFVTLKGREFWEGEQSYWGATNYPTYIKLRPGTDVVEFENKLQRVTQKYLLPHWLQSGRSNAKELAKNVSFELQPVLDIYLRSSGISDSLPSHGDIRFVWLFGAVAFFILIIASINFINLSTARSANRAKEVGLRKVVGSVRRNIIGQFLTESVLYSLMSFVIGVVLAGLLLPYFNLLSDKDLIFPWKEWWLFPVLLSAAFVVGILAGLYPAFYLSAFKPISVLKGNLSRGSKNSMTRSSLVILQFTISIILITATFVVYRQVEYMLNKKLGFDKEQIILIQGTNTLGDQIKTFKNELLNISQVTSVSISDYLPVSGTKRNGNSFWNEGRRTIDKSVGTQFWIVDHDYIRTMGMKLTEGRDFSKDMISDTSSLIINQSMAKELGLKDPIGKRIQNWRVYTVIGVVEDFHSESLRDVVEPLVLGVGISPSIVSVKVNTKDMAGVIQSITDVWKKFSPHQSIRYAFMDERYAAMYADVLRMGRIFTTFAILAIIVACLGLFALASFMVEQKSKEISIRLVLGASLKSIFQLLTSNFMRLVLISIVLAIPIAWYAMDKWLQDFAYPADMGWEIFVWPGVMAMIIALATVSYQSIRAALMSPAQNLRSE